MKKYLKISEVSNLLGLEENIIRYWDSVDPKTNKLRIEGLSTKSQGGTRYFNRDNLNKLKSLKNLIYENGNYNSSIKLADRLISSNKIRKNINNDSIITRGQNAKKIEQILNKMRDLLR